MKGLKKDIWLVVLAIACIAFGCVDGDQGDAPNSSEEESTESSNEEEQEQPTTSPVGNTGAAASFTLYETVCQLVQVSCGNAGIFSHNSVQTELVSNNRVLTKYSFESADGEVSEVTEECGSYSAPNGENFSSANECRIQGLIKGNVFVVTDGAGRLVEVFRTDMSGSAVTNAYGLTTNLEDLQELQERWNELLVVLPGQQECIGELHRLDAEACPGDSSLY